MAATLIAFGCATEETRKPERLKAGSLFDSELAYQQPRSIKSGIYCSENLGDDFSQSTPNCSPRADGTSPWLNHVFFRQDSPTVVEAVRGMPSDDFVDAWITFELGSSYDSVGYRPFTNDLRIYGAHLTVDQTGVEVRLPALYACAVLFGGSGIDTVSLHAITIPTPGLRPTVIPFPRDWVACYSNPTP